MAVSTSWMHQWQPPNDLLLDTHIVHDHHGPFNLSSIFPRRRKHGDLGPPGLGNFFPYLLSLGLFSNNKKPKEEKPKLRPRSQPIPFETTGPFRTWYQWNELDFAYDTALERKLAVESGKFIPENNLPLGIEIYKDRLFVTMPKWKPGVPATLAVLPRVPKEPSPLMVPYPSWEWHTTGICTRLISVFRMQADSCGRLWVLDSGQIDITIEPKQVCPPQIFIFDLETDKLIERYQLPQEFIKEDGLYSNILVDLRNEDCEDPHAYLSDVWRYGLVVFSLKRKRSWRITDHLFYPEPLAAAYNVQGLEFEWTDGLFGMALSPYNKRKKDRILYFHPMSSFRQFYTLTSIVCNETGWQDYKDGFKVLGQSRGKLGHVSASGMDRNGVLLYNLVSKSGVGCWDSRKSYARRNLGIVAQNNETLIFPNDLKIDDEKRQSVWTISNRLPFYLYKTLDKKEVNYRIMSAYIDEAITGTICDPDTKEHRANIHADDEDCLLISNYFN